ncbi:RNA polymerase sigma factor [Pelagibius litoralis]|uniref:RNA polymerase sigma factor n=1 Tax=Pelagibius litoralis TaxID=374515 RepID=A0A967CAJ7_9PROT|nr:RNA polymerase sigma factor [Pelagibius litoralis]NIA67723.1 RNA polymerase sigma factor [Pelagibius litoralis]
MLRDEIVALLPQLRRFAYGLAGSVPDGDDLVQATCERAIANLEKWEKGTRLDSWMYRIAQNLHFNALRDGKTRARHLAVIGSESQWSLDGEKQQEDRFALTAVRRFIDRLPEEQRIVLLLICVEGRSYREVSQITGLPVGTVTSRLGRARSAMRGYLEEEGAEANTDGSPDGGIENGKMENGR